MKKIIKPILTSILLMLLTSIGFFMSLYLPTSERTVSQAYVTGRAGEVINLTSHFGTTPTHYFTDEGNESTLVNAVASDSEIKYHNEKGELVSDFYVIVSDSDVVFKKNSYGYSTFCVPTEMKGLAQKGALYVQASVGVISGKNEANSNVEIRLIQGETTKTVKSDSNTYGVNVEQWLKTDFIKVDGQNDITFYFTNLGQGSKYDTSEFKLVEPKLIFKTVISGVEIDDSTENVSPGQVIKLNPTNEVLSTTGSSNYLKYCRNIHKAEYEIIEGSSYAEIIDGYLYITEENVDAQVTIVARSKRDSIEGGYVESQPKTYTITSKKYEIKITSDFENPADFFGEGSYQVGQMVVLNLNLNDRFTFVNWEINGEIQTSRRVFYTVQEENNIKCNVKKSIYVSSVELADRVYDGTSRADCKFIIDGIENGHDVSIGGLTTKFIDAEVGENKYVSYDGYPELVGENADLYILDATSIPSVTGTIKKKDVKITTHDMSKTYGDIDDAISYETDDNAISGKLSREEGESVGRYLINIGELNAKNPNYNCVLQGKNYYTIVERNIWIESLQVEDKEYDGTTKAQFKSYNIANRKGADNIDLEMEISFKNCNAGEREIQFDKAEITGEAKENYKLILDGAIFKATIKQKPLKVQAKGGESIFGDEIVLDYTSEGLIEGDLLTGELSIDSRDVGTYVVTQNSLANANYIIEFVNAKYTIKQRDISIVAENIEKIYGENDPELTYHVENFVEDEPLDGKLERKSGNSVGKYKINIGTLANSNYNIVEFTAGNFEIKTRKISLDVSVENKEYDGSTSAKYTYFLSNVADNDKIEFNATMEFEDANVGEEKNIVIKNSYFFGEGLSNYTIEEIFGELKASIKRKDVFVTVENKTATYGDEDVALTYRSEGLIGEESLFGSLSREEGRDVGNYEIRLNDITNENNKNYNIISKNQAYYTILAEEIEVKACVVEKTYGEEDPEFTYALKDVSKLKYDDTKEEIFSGILVREEGEIPGIYAITIGSLVCSKNYKIKVFEEGSLVIQKKKIQVIAENSQKTYGEEDPEFRYSASDLVSGDRLSIKLKREYGENVGSYVITYLSLNDQRYNIDFKNAEFNISPKEITVKADEKFKEYGESDPTFTVSVVEGKLENDDEIEEIEEGKMTRQEGEDVGEYEIQLGDYSLGKNYSLKFEVGKINIMQVNLGIKADNISKKYGNKDVELTYTISDGALKRNDKITGKLAREEGEEIGSYKISEGTIGVNSNYILTFTSGIFTIEKRPLVITANAVTKIYGEEDPELTYTLDRNLREGDVLSGSLEREKPSTAGDPYAYEKTGRYLISSTLNNENYEITYVSAYLTIQRREITIVADNKQKTYGESDPELTYTIKDGEILDGEALTGDIYRVSGDNVGTYDIRSNLSLGRNYKINFIKGNFVIKPIDIYINTHDYEKIYGDITPTFEYEITSGELLEGDTLLGGISKEGGEEVGKFQLVSAFNNINYNVILTENYITIHPKKAYLSVYIQDKVFDGTTVAYIKNPVITGLIDDDVKLYYDKEDSAKFEDAEVGNDKNVTIFNISLVGDKAKNYELVYPQNLKASITHSELATEEKDVLLSTTTNTSLNLGTKLVVNDENVDYSSLISSSKQLVAKFNVSLEENNEKKEIKDSITVKFEIPAEYGDRTNFYVYGRNRNGNYTLLSVTRNGQYLEVETDTLSDFVILSDNEQWIDIGSYISLGIISLFAIYGVIRVAKKSIKKKKKSA